MSYHKTLREIMEQHLNDAIKHGDISQADYDDAMLYIKGCERPVVRRGLSWTDRTLAMLAGAGAGMLVVSFLRWWFG